MVFIGGSDGSFLSLGKAGWVKVLVAPVVSAGGGGRIGIGCNGWVGVGCAGVVGNDTVFAWIGIRVGLWCIVLVLVVAVV